MNTELTLSMEEDVVIRAKKYARERGDNLSVIIENYLKAITWKQKPTDKASSINQSLRGSVKVPKDFDYKKELENETAKKYLQ